MKFKQKVGNLQIYTRQNAKYDFTVSIYNGSDKVYSEDFFSPTEEEAINWAMQYMDYYTVEFIHQFVENVIKHSDNIYCTPERTDWFCRVDDTHFFKHFSKKESEFIRDKFGKRIIDE